MNLPRRTAPANAPHSLTSIAHRAKRKNLPPAGIESHGEVREEPVARYWHNAHLPPQLLSAPDSANVDRLREVLAASRRRPLTEDESRLLDNAIRRHEPWLNWTGKRERPWFEVDPVALHMHERVSAQAILRVLARQDVNRSLFADPKLDYAQTVQFYRHDVDWANRMILGDSLQVMASLARREDLAGKVQMIYVDPPYGIKFGSNFQPELGQRDVKDTANDLTREPETIRAYRDTWTLGVHSYLSYLRDRLAIMRDLLSPTGSIFVQISDENVHRVRCLMDEVFGGENFCRLISIRKTAGDTTRLLTSQADYIIWYSRDIEKVKFQPLFLKKEVGTGTGRQYDRVLDPSTGFHRRLSKKEPLQSDGSSAAHQAFRTADLRRKGFSRTATIECEYQGSTFYPGPSHQWKTNAVGLTRLRRSERLHLVGKTLEYRRYYSDWSFSNLTNIWTDAGGSGFADPRIYAVQTVPRVIQRCLLMTTDPGDLVLDPTCGSGTTAYVAEQWGRRWITTDTSRVALTLAKHRLMTTKFEYYRLRELEAEDVARNPEGPWISDVDAAGEATGRPMTFHCRRVPHVTLRSIVRNASLDPLFEKHEPVLAAALARLNEELRAVPRDTKGKLTVKLVEKHRCQGARAVNEADIRRWLLPGAPVGAIRPAPARKGLKALTLAQAEKYCGRIPGESWQEWEVPFDSDPDWPPALRGALREYLEAWRAKMKEVNGCIEANADLVELVDQPDTVDGTVRVAGPFTMEGVIAMEEGPDTPFTPIGGAPTELEAFDDRHADRVGLLARNAEAHLDKVLRLLKATGVDFPGNRKMKLIQVEPVTDPTRIHAEGYWENGAQITRRVAVSIGPEAGNVPALQVEEAVRAANRIGYDDLVFAGFGFDAAAQEAIEDSSHPKMRLHMALINPDVAMDDLLKTQPGNQIFTVFSAPRVAGPITRGDGRYTVAVEGMDVYDPVKSTLHPTDKTRIAAWFLDTDYDGRTFCICQAFFPDRKKWDKLAKALGDAGMVERRAFEALSGLESLPFERSGRLNPAEGWRIAVKVIDPRGNEGLRVITVDAVSA